MTALMFEQRAIVALCRHTPATEGLATDLKSRPTLGASLARLALLLHHSAALLAAGCAISLPYKPNFTVANNLLSTKTSTGNCITRERIDPSEVRWSKGKLLQKCLA